MKDFLGSLFVIVSCMKLSFLQWNVWYLEDIHNVVNYLKKNPADIIALQELTTNHPGQSERDTAAYIAKQLGHEYCVGGESFHEDNEDRWFGNAVFSKYPIKDYRQVWINEPIGTGGFDDEYRTYLEAVVDAQGTKLVVATTHMSYTHKFEVTPRKRLETDKLTKELRSIDSANIVFSGDLNATPDSYTLREVGSILQSADPGSEEKTWTTKPFSYQGFEENGLNWRLDYIFASKAVKVLSSRIDDTEVSDHLPLRAEFEI